MTVINMARDFGSRTFLLRTSLTLAESRKAAKQLFETLMTAIKLTLVWHSRGIYFIWVFSEPQTSSG